jgi:hypothetical protein
MQEITITISHTDVEESILLMNAGVPAETADMMIEQFKGKEPKYLFGFYKRTLDYYPEYYKPCWSADRLRSMLDDLGVQSLRYGGAGQVPVSKLVPTVIAGFVMKNPQANIQEPEDPRQLKLFS